MSDGSVSQWLSRLKQGDHSAAQQLWTRYAQRLTELARHKLREMPKRASDEEDIAQSVFGSICAAATAGRISDVRNREELWWLLLAITKRKAVDHSRRETAQKRGAGRVHLESEIKGVCDKTENFTMDQLVSDEPTPEFVVMLNEQHSRLLGLLRDDQLRRIASCRIEGYSVSEIAEHTQLSTRSIERKLQLIRDEWSKELQS